MARIVVRRKHTIVEENNLEIAKKPENTLVLSGLSTKWKIGIAFILFILVNFIFLIIFLPFKLTKSRQKDIPVENLNQIIISGKDYSSQPHTELLQLTLEDRFMASMHFELLYRQKDQFATFLTSTIDKLTSCRERPRKDFKEAFNFLPKLLGKAMLFLLKSLNEVDTRSLFDAVLFYHGSLSLLMELLNMELPHLEDQETENKTLNTLQLLLSSENMFFYFFKHREVTIKKFNLIFKNKLPNDFDVAYPTSEYKDLKSSLENNASEMFATDLTGQTLDTGNEDLKITLHRKIKNLTLVHRNLSVYSIWIYYFLIEEDEEGIAKIRGFLMGKLAEDKKTELNEKFRQDFGNLRKNTQRLKEWIENDVGVEQRVDEVSIWEGYIDEVGTLLNEITNHLKERS